MAGPHSLRVAELGLEPGCLTREWGCPDCDALTPLPQTRRMQQGTEVAPRGDGGAREPAHEAQLRLRIASHLTLLEVGSSCLEGRAVPGLPRGLGGGRMRRARAPSHCQRVMGLPGTGLAESPVGSQPALPAVLCCHVFTGSLCQARLT